MRKVLAPSAVCGPHPARFPRGLPEFFIKFLTNDGDTVLDPFAGSCVTETGTKALMRSAAPARPVRFSVMQSDSQ